MIRACIVIASLNGFGATEIVCYDLEPDEGRAERASCRGPSNWRGTAALPSLLGGGFGPTPYPSARKPAHRAPIIETDPLPTPQWLDIRVCADIKIYCDVLQTALCCSVSAPRTA